MPRRAASTSGALLAVAALRPPPDGTAGPPLVTALRRHRLAPLGCVVLGRAGHATAELLRADLDTAVSTHVRALASLADLAAALGELPWAVLKGPVLSELAHPVPGARAYSDVDVLVRPADLRAAVSALRSRGWVLLDRSHRLVLERMPGELHLLGPHGVTVDLHWSLVNDVAVRRRVELPADVLLQRRVVRTLSVGPVPCLDDVDALLHLCLHTALAGADRLLWLVDLDTWVRATAVDWAVLADRAHRSGAAVAAALCLRRARAALGTPVPAGLDRTLVPARWWHVAARATDRAQPVAALAADRSFARLFARACRGTAGASAVELARRAPRALTADVAAPARESVGQDRPDERAWQAYLSAVERSGVDGRGR